jgi:hypothetical protein
VAVAAVLNHAATSTTTITIVAIEAMDLQKDPILGFKVFLIQQ